MLSFFQKIQQLSLLTRILLISSLAVVVTLSLFYLGLGKLPLFALLSLPGYFFDMIFSASAFLLPLYLAGMAYINQVSTAGWFHLTFIQMIWLPLFTLSPLFKILSDDRRAFLTSWMVSVFGREGAIFLLGFLVVVELFVILGLALTWRDKLFTVDSKALAAQDEGNVAPVQTEHEIKTTDATEFRDDSGEIDIRHDPFFDDAEEDQGEVTNLQARVPESAPGLSASSQDEQQHHAAVLHWDKLKTRVSQKEPGQITADYYEQVDPAETVFGAIFGEQNEGRSAEELPLSSESESERERQPITIRSVKNHDSQPGARPRVSYTNYRLAAEGLLKKHSGTQALVRDETIEHNSRVLEETLGEFGIEARVVGIKKGPVVTLYEILPAPGVKLSRIVALADNIALVLACGSVRIVAPIPGKNAVGVEVPNPRRQIVGFDELVQSQSFRESNDELPLALGKDIAGDLQIIDLARTPHLLIAGATGSGKSVMVNSLICSLLFSKSPDEVRLLLVDPKIVELKFFNDIPHLLTPVITDPKKALMAAQWCLAEMERRYSLLDSLGVRDIRGYNAKVRKKNIATSHLPYIVFIIDEFADLMATSGKELEGIIARLAAMSRAVGIHLVLATQRPSIDVITGLIKANFPSRIAFMVASKTDSRIILDQTGAENLLGKGDMLFSSAWEPFPKRIQAAYLSEEEVENVVTEVKKQGDPDYISDEIFIEEDEDVFADESALDDPLWKKAVEIVTSTKKASASYLQRRMSIGYNRAARLIEEMERQGIVGPQNGSKPREIIASLASMIGGGA